MVQVSVDINLPHRLLKTQTKSIPCAVSSLRDSWHRKTTIGYVCGIELVVFLV
jgi:hypothetical protein